MSVDGTLTGEPNVFVRVTFPRRIVVMGVDPFDFDVLRVDPHPIRKRLPEAVHHLLPIGEGKPLGPTKFGDVAVDFCGAFA